MQKRLNRAWISAFSDLISVNTFSQPCVCVCVCDLVSDLMEKLRKSEEEVTY